MKIMAKLLQIIFTFHIFYSSTHSEEVTAEAEDGSTSSTNEIIFLEILSITGSTSIAKENICSEETLPANNCLFILKDRFYGHQ